MRAGEFVLAMDPERVIPHHPVPQHQAMRSLNHHFELGHVFIPDCQPERAIGFEDAGNLVRPALAPVQIFFVIEFVAVDIVLVADVKRWICKDEVHRARGNALHAFDAIHAVHIILWESGHESLSRIHCCGFSGMIRFC